MATAVFGVVVLFFAPVTLFQTMSLRRELNSIKSQQQEYQQRISSDSAMIYRLKHDDEFLEKYAREHFYMKAPDETIYIIDN